MAKATIGGVEYDVSLPNFKKLKAAWRHIAAIRETDVTDPMAGIDAILGVIAVGMVGASMTLDELEDALRPDEIPGLRSFVVDILAEITPKAEAGEASPAGENASLSTGTSMPSSPTSSPDLEALTGTSLKEPGTSTDTPPFIDLGDGYPRPS